MKQKIGTVLEEDTLRRLKERAAQQRRPMSDIIAEALTHYLRSAPNASQRHGAVERFCSRPFRLSPRQWAALDQEDYYDQ